MNSYAVLKLAILVGLTALAVLFTLYYLLNAFIATSIILVGLYILANEIAQINTFRGGGFIARRMVERDLGSALAKRFRRLLLALMSVLKALREKEVLFDFSSTSDDIYYFLEVLTVTDLNLKKVFEMNGKFTKSETDFSNQVERLRQLLNGTQLVERSLGAKMTVWNFLKNFDILGKATDSYSFSRSDQSDELINLVTSMADKCLLLQNQQQLKGQSFDNRETKILKRQQSISFLLKTFLFDSTFGTTDQMRALLLVKYTSKVINIPVECSLSLKAIIILPGKKKDLEGFEKPNSARLTALEQIINPLEEQNSQLGSKDDFEELTRKVKNSPFVIICQNNGGFYEVLCYDRHLIEFYLSHGVGVLLWNYRGYAANKGTPTLENLASDGMKVFQFLKEKIDPPMIAVHGTSLGGHVAKALSPHVDVVVADRTFNSISYIPYLTFAPLLQKIYDLLIENTHTHTASFMTSEAKKIVLYDPSDRIVPLFASVVTGIMPFFLKTSFGLSKNLNTETDKGRECFCFSKVRNSCKQAADFESLLQVIQDSEILLKKEEHLVTYRCLRRLFYACLKAMPESEASSKLDYSSEELFRGDVEPERAPLNLAAKGDFGLRDKENQLSLSPDDYKMVKSSDFGYYNLIDEKNLSESILKIFQKIMHALGLVEGASLTVTDIFIHFESDYQFTAYKLVWLNMLFWGAKSPSHTLKDLKLNPQSPVDTQLLAIAKLETSIKLLQKMTNELSETLKPGTILDKGRKAMKWLHRDLVVIIANFRSILTNLATKSKELLGVSLEVDRDLIVRTGQAREEVETFRIGGDAELSDPDDRAFLNVEYFNFRKKFTLIPQRAGHNAKLGPKALKALKHSLITAGFMKPRKIP